MKKIIFLFMLLIVVKANAQLYVKVLDLTTGNEKYQPYIAGITVVSGVSQKYVDSVTTILKNSLNNKADKGSVIGGTSEGQIINLPEQTWWKIIQPNSYGNTYSNGSKQGRWFMGGYRTNAGVNFSTTDRPDIVQTIMAYNISLPNGGREFSNEAAWDMSIETHYDNSGFLPYGDFEAHLFRVYDSKGGEHRYHSIYPNKTTGHARQDFEADAIDFMRTRTDEGKNPFTYAHLTEASWDLWSEKAGRVVGYTATDWDGTTVKINEIGGVGFLKVPGVIDADGYGKAILLPNIGTYLNDVDAKTNGHLVSKQNYWVVINGIKVLAQVQ